jgi:hypothetical protein
VGGGTLLTVLGSIYQGSNALRELQVLDSDGTILQRWSVSSSGAFRVDLSNFGSPGRKTLRLRVIDSAGLYSETSIPVINDDAELEAQARQFLKKYNVAPDGGTLRFGVTNIPIVVPDSLKQYWQVFEEACSFWNKYCPIVHLYPTTSNSNEYVIRVFDETNQNSQYAAVTNRTYNGHEIVSASIDLYKDWLGVSNDAKAEALAHELGHALYTENEITEYGSYFVQWPYGPAEIQKVIVPPVVQRGIRMLYSNPPGWTP